MSGDICPNPGPSATAIISAKCAVCARTVAKTHRAVNCDSCSRWCHIKCGCVSVNEYRRMQLEEEFPWICPICIASSDSMLLHSLVEDSTLECLHTHDLELYEDLEPLINTQGLKVAHLNVYGLLNKMSEIRFLLQETSFDILGLTETHLNNKIEEDQISVDGYKMVRKDRISGSWGGCVMYYKKCLNVIERDDICSKSDLEQVWIDLMLASQRLLLGTFYRPPTDNLFFDKFHAILDGLWLKRSNIMIMGDFNSDIKSSVGKRLLKVTRNVGLENVIKDTTRSTESSNTIIDLIFTSHKSKVKLAGCYAPGISDHHLVYAVVNLRRQKSCPVIKEVTDFKNLDCDKLRLDLSTAPWNVFEIFDEVDDVAWAWEYLYKDVMS